LADLERDERVLAWGATDDGEPMLATQLGLWAPMPDGRRRIGWHEINKAAWKEGLLTVTEAVHVESDVVEDAAPCRWSIAEPGKLPVIIRKRVEGSVAFTEHHSVGAVGVRVVARRVPGRNGLSWWVRYDRPGDHERPDVPAKVEALLTEAQARMTPPD